jgi:hypothetical protein
MRRNFALSGKNMTNPSSNNQLLPNAPVEDKIVLQVFARLLVDRGLNGRFRASPTTVYQHLGLPCDWTGGARVLQLLDRVQAAPSQFRTRIYSALCGVDGVVEALPIPPPNLPSDAIRG